MKKFIYVFFCLFFVNSISWPEHKCLEDKVCISVGSLSSDPVSKSLRKTLNLYAQREGQPGASLDGLGIRPYLPLFQEKFIVTQVLPGSLGGYWVNIILSTKKMVPLLLWIYDIGEDEYEIRSIKKIKVSQSDRKSLEPLRSEEFIKYWL